MQPLKDTEEFVGKFHIETNPVITNKDGCPPLRVLGSHFNARRLASSGKLNGVPEEIRENLLDECCIALHGGQCLDVPIDSTSAGAITEFFNKIVNQKPELHRLAIYVTAAYARKVQQIVDQLTHPFRALFDAGQIVFSFVGKLGCEVGLQD